MTGCIRVDGENIPKLKDVVSTKCAGEWGDVLKNAYILAGKRVGLGFGATLSYTCPCQTLPLLWLVTAYLPE